LPPGAELFTRQSARLFSPPKHTSAVEVAQIVARDRESLAQLSFSPGGEEGYSGRSMGNRVSSICSAAYR
jgi:hypothetical protein